MNENDVSLLETPMKTLKNMVQNNICLNPQQDVPLLRYSSPNRAAWFEALRCWAHFSEARQKLAETKGLLYFIHVRRVLAPPC